MAKELGRIEREHKDWFMWTTLKRKELHLRASHGMTSERWAWKRIPPDVAHEEAHGRGTVEEQVSRYLHPAGKGLEMAGEVEPGKTKTGPTWMQVVRTVSDPDRLFSTTKMPKTVSDIDHRVEFLQRVRERALEAWDERFEGWWLKDVVFALEGTGVKIVSSYVKQSSGARRQTSGASLGDEKASDVSNVEAATPATPEASDSLFPRSSTKVYPSTGHLASMTMERLGSLDVKYCFNCGGLLTARTAPRCSTCGAEVRSLTESL